MGQVKSSAALRERLGGMPPAAGASVQAFYERYPYPPPVHDLDAYHARWQDGTRRRADFHLFWPTRPFSEGFSVLVAGCGTSQAAKYAMRWPKAFVTGIDFSAESLRHTLKLKHTYALDNLELRQLPLEKARDLETQFDLIVCTGVLHHLPDPHAGLAALHDALKRDGALHLMVYAPYGRSGIYMLQEFFRRVRLDAPDEGLADILGALRALPQSHPLYHLLRETPDFRAESALADALLHPQDRAYSVPQLFELLRAARFRFGRWIRQGPYSLQTGLLSRLPQAMRMAPIPLEDRYAAAELFRGNMMRHSVVAYRSEHPHIPEIAFADGSWLDFVPIRVPDTLCVEEQLPSGIAGILINRTHADADILLPLRAHEKQIFEAIDGKRTVRALLSSQPDPTPGLSLFERLWWHDQIVFDATPRHRAAALHLQAGDGTVRQHTFRAPESGARVSAETSKTQDA